MAYTRGFHHYTNLTSDSLRSPAAFSAACNFASPFMVTTSVAVALMATRLARKVAASW